ncbi:MAG: hypothetical protein ACFFAO_13630 [Candidatus Hermodarchaeota archaeon]
MLERTQSFGIKDKSNTDIQKIMEDVLQKSLNYSTKTAKLGNTLLRINYFDENIDKELQKENKITILKDPEKKIYVKVNGKISDEQINQLWNELAKSLEISDDLEKYIEKIFSKDEIISNITKKIQDRGYNIVKSDAETFIENFQERYNRLPKKDEINSIVKGYIIMIDQDNLIHKEEEITSITKEVSTENNVNIFKETLDKLTVSKHSNPISLRSYENGVLVIEKPLGRRKCPSCNNEGLIHEIDDKSIILMDYPRIYGKKCCCAECGCEWRET